MKIRSITCFIDPSYPLNVSKLNVAGELLRFARPLFTDAGYEVQSARIASVPFPWFLTDLRADTLSHFAAQLEEAAGRIGYEYVSLGPALPEMPASYGLIPAALAATRNAFFSGSMITMDGKVSLKAIRQCAEVIMHASSISLDGFGNLRFAALANVPAGSPFFPAAYHQGGDPVFALATEAADLAIEAVEEVSNLEELRHNLVTVIETHASALTRIASQIEERVGVRFGGIDFSLAPFPSEERSLGTAMEQLGVPTLGNHGSLAAAAFLAGAIDQANFKRAGFSGLFFPVLEDATLARRASEGSLGVKDLLLYSAVCGTGLDIVPLPGDTTVEQLCAVLLDLASLSTRLGKPLTARLMPIPGKKAGDPTGFDFAYFTNSRVLPLQGRPLVGLLATDEAFTLHRRSPR